MNRIHRDCIWLVSGHVWLHTTPEGLWPHYMILEVSSDCLRTLFTISWSWLLARVWSGPKLMWVFIESLFLTSNFPANPFLVDGWFLPYISDLTPLSIVKLITNNKSTWLFTHIRHVRCTTWRLLECVTKMSKWEVVIVFLCVGSLCELTPIYG